MVMTLARPVVPALLALLAVFTLLTALVIAYLAFKVRLEEKLLAARYPEYPSYRKRTWGLLPGWRG